MKRNGVSIYYATVLLFICIFVPQILIGCRTKPCYTLVNEGKDLETLQAPDGTKYRLYRRRDKENIIENRFLWGVLPLKENGKDVVIGYTKNRGLVYATTEAFCIESFLPEVGTFTWIEESFAFPEVKVEKFDRIEIQGANRKAENTVLEDELCIRAIIDRMLTREYDVRKEKTETTEKNSRGIRLYSRDYPGLYLYISVYWHPERKEYYILDWSNLDYIECTDIIEQYLSEYFE